MMTKPQTTDTVVNRTQYQEMDMRDILGSMEELANMIGIRTSHHCEIISIEAPGTDSRELCNPRQSHLKQDLQPHKAQVIYFRK